MPSKIRLIRIASEINISKDTIVEFLASKGFEIENKPAYVLSEEMTSAVYEKFQKEKNLADEQREKLVKQKARGATAEKEKSTVTKTVEKVATVFDDFDSNSNETVKKETVEKTPVEIKTVEDTVEAKEVKKKETPTTVKSASAKTTKSVVDIKDLKNIVDMTPKIGDVIFIDDSSFSKPPPRRKPTQKEEEKKSDKKTTKSTSKTTDKKEKSIDKKITDDEKIKNISERAKATREKEKSVKKSADKKTETVKKIEKNEKSEEKLSATSIKSKKTKKNEKVKEVETVREVKDKKTISKTEKTKDKKNNGVRIDFETTVTVDNNTVEEKTVENEIEASPIKVKKQPLPESKNNVVIAKPAIKELNVLGKIEIKKKEGPDFYQRLVKEKEKEKREKEREKSDKFFKSRKGSGERFGDKNDKKDGQNDRRSGDRDRNDRNFKRDGRDDRPFDRDKNKGKGKGEAGQSTYHSHRKFPPRDGESPKRDGEFRRDGDRPAGQGRFGDRPKRDGEFKDKNDRFDKTGKPKDSKDKAKAGSQTTSKGTERGTERTFERKVFTDNAPPKGSKAPLGYEEKKKRNKMLRDSITSEDVSRAIRSTLAGMEDTGSEARKAKIKQKKKEIREEKVAKQQERIEREAKILRLTEFVTTSDLAAMVNIKAGEIILKCMQLGLMVTINQRLDKDTIQLIADDYGFAVEFIEEIEFEDIAQEVDDEASLVTRPPIVTIMGHVDHGKTSLLDHIRNTNIVAGEAGGITQHIGAYRVVLKNGKAITFLDTPGHEAFTAMRARGAQVTDIVVIVVAADDSVMPQTIEAISHAKAANVPIVVAINKVDKAEANVDRIKQQLSEQGILTEDWGGTFQHAEISAKKGTNVNVLLDKILVEAEMLDLKANPDRNASGVVIESKMMKGLGNVASIIVQRGTLCIGDTFVVGANFGKTRVLLDEREHRVNNVLPSQPVVVVGIDGLPEAGDTFTVVTSESEARDIASRRRALRREQDLRKVRHTTLDDISEQIALGGVKDLKLIVKGDVAGSVEALSDSLLKLSNPEVRVNIILKGAGLITESDVMLASASSAIIIGFNIASTPQAAKQAEISQVEIRNYNIIYNCMNDIHLALEGMLRPDIKEEIAAVIEVRQTFKISKVGQIAGCYVSSGKLNRNDKVRILRDGFQIFSSTIASLKRNKDDVRDVDTNYECGIQVANFNSFEIGDIIEAVRFVEVKRTLAR